MQDSISHHGGIHPRTLRPSFGTARYFPGCRRAPVPTAPFLGTREEQQHPPALGQPRRGRAAEDPGAPAAASALTHAAVAVADVSSQLAGLP